VASGKGTYAPILPDRSLGTRGDDGPVWSPGGKSLAYVFASRLHLSPVDEAGQLLGPPKALNDEVTDAVSWSGDGRSLVYISAGQLKLISATGGAPKIVPHGLTWANVRPKGRMVVRATRLWDGRSKDRARERRRPDLRRPDSRRRPARRGGGRRHGDRRADRHGDAWPDRHAHPSPDAGLRLR
jgi:hypothetical protein